MLQQFFPEKEIRRQAKQDYRSLEEGQKDLLQEPYEWWEQSFLESHGVPT